MANNFQSQHYGAMFASNNDKYDLQRSYQYYADFTQAAQAFANSDLNTNSQGGTVISNGMASESNGMADYDVLTFAVQSFNPPSMSNSPIEYYFGNNKIKLAGKAEVATGDMTMVDFVMPDVEAILITWYNKVYNLKTEKTQLSSAYKWPIKLTQWAGDGSIERTWQLEGCFPTSISFGNLDYTSNDKKQISITFSIDLAYRLYGKN